MLLEFQLNRIKQRFLGQFEEESTEIKRKK